MSAFHMGKVIQNFIFYFFIIFIYFIYLFPVFFWLCWVLAAACGVFVEVYVIFRCGTGSLLWCTGFPLVVVCGFFLSPVVACGLQGAWAL